jgi:hypothetical protein
MREISTLRLFSLFFNPKEKIMTKNSVSDTQQKIESGLQNYQQFAHLFLDGVEKFVDFNFGVTKTIINKIETIEAK